MNPINLTTLSLSALLTSSMLCGAFAMELPEIDSSSPIRSVKSAKEMFESPLKIETKDVRIDFKKDLENAQGGGAQYLQNRIKIKEDAEVQAKSLQQKIEELTSKIPVQEEELRNLQEKTKKVEEETQRFNNNVLISKNGYLNLYTYNNPATSFHSWMYGIAETPTNLNTNNVNIEDIKEDLIEQPKQNKRLILEEKHINTGNVIFSEELASLKGKEELKFLALQKQVEVLESDIVAAKEEFKKKTAEREQAEKKFNTDKADALLTRDMLLSISPSKWLNSSSK